MPPPSYASSVVLEVPSGKVTTTVIFSSAVTARLNVATKWMLADAGNVVAGSLTKQSVEAVPASNLTVPSRAWT